MGLKLRKSWLVLPVAVAALAVIIAAELLWLNPDAAEGDGLAGPLGLDAGGLTANDQNKEICGEGYYYTIEFDCWQKKDNRFCYGVRENPAGYCAGPSNCGVSGCCPNPNDCRMDGRCYVSGKVFTGDMLGIMCYEGKFGLCREDDVCEEVGGYYCTGDTWVEEEPANCEGGISIKPPEPEDSNAGTEPKGDCPEGEFYRGEWDCFERGDDEKCGSADAGHGCCASEGQCWFGGRCYAGGKPLSESSEWICTEGMWDKCIADDRCEKQGTYLCNGLVWSALAPEGCE
ncbi:MAG: hypothetical protein V1676_06435 [Candidatus Diapherotrites archaeon]